MEANEWELSKEEALSKIVELVHENGSINVVVRGVYVLALMQAPEIVWNGINDWSEYNLDESGLM